MAQDPKKINAQDAPATRRRPRHSDVYRELLAEAAQHPAAHAYLGRALRVIARHLQSPFSAVYARFGSEVVQDHCHFGPTDPKFWEPAVQQFLTDALVDNAPRTKRLSARNSALKIALLSAPLYDPRGSTMGAIAVVVSRTGQTDLTLLSLTLQALAALASRCTSAPAPTRTPAADDTAAQHSASCSHAAELDTPEALAFEITNSLRNQHGFALVALGLVTQQRVRLLSISGLDEVRPQSPGVVLMQAAMEEALDADSPIIFQASSAWSEDRVSKRYHLHRQWHAACGNEAVASIPLRCGERCVGVLSVRKGSEKGFSREEILEVHQRVEAFAPALIMARRAGRSLTRHAAEWLADGLRRLRQPGHWGRKAAAAALTALTLYVVFGTMNYRIAAACSLQPQRVTHLSAPQDGIIERGAAVAGERVRRGALLGALQRTDLLQQRAELRAELAVVERTRDRGMAEQDAVEVQLALANRRLLMTRLEILERRLQHTELRAPFDGVVVAGDLSRSIGSTVAQGTPLFEVAPLDDWQVELRVPEAAVEDVAAGLRGYFQSHALPEEGFAFEISRVRPKALTGAGGNVFLAEARVLDAAPWFKAGMEGVAHVDVGPRRVYWVLSHRLMDYLRLKFWI